MARMPHMARWPADYPRITRFSSPSRYSFCPRFPFFARAARPRFPFVARATGDEAFLIRLTNGRSLNIKFKCRKLLKPKSLFDHQQIWKI